MFDSVFSEFVSHSEVPLRYENDTPILGYEEIDETLDEAEAKWGNLILAVSWDGVDKLLARLSKPLDSLDLKAIDEEMKKFSVAGAIQALLFGAWQEMFKTGTEAGTIEVNEINRINREKKEKGEKKVLFSSSEDLAEFRRKRKPAFEIAYPPDHEEASLIEMEELREALNLRTQVLADDVSQDLSDRISNVIRETVVQHSTRNRQIGGTVTGLSKYRRTQLVQKINGIIGRERQRLKGQGVPDSQLPRKKIRIPEEKLDFPPASGEAVYARRANMIAATELNAGYNLGRLNAYAKRGVKYVRWQAIGDVKTCSLCRSRNGIVEPLSTVLRAGLRTAETKNPRVKYKRFQLVLPAHPNCRCAWQAVTEKESKEKGRKGGKPVPLGKNWATVGAAAALTTAVVKGKDIVLTAQELAVETEREERSKRKARSRALLSVGGALSLGVLSYGLWSWINRRVTAPPKTTTAPVAKKVPVETGTPRPGVSLGVLSSPAPISRPGTVPLPEVPVPGVAIPKVPVPGVALPTVRPSKPIEPIEVPAFIEKARVMIRDLVGEEAQRKHIISQEEDRIIEAFLSLEERKKELDEERIEGKRFLPSAWLERHPQLASIDTRDFTDETLKARFALNTTEVSQLRLLQNNFLRSQYTPMYQKVLPGNVLSDRDINRYPWLIDMEDIRELNPKLILRKIYTDVVPNDEKSAEKRAIARREAFALHRRIIKRLRQKGVGISAVSQAEKNAVQAINEAQTKEELSAVFNVPQREDIVLSRIWDYKQQKNAPITSIYQLVEEVKGVNYKTITTSIAKMSGKRINLIQLMSSNDRETVEAIFRDRLFGVDKRKAPQMYEAMKRLGERQILDTTDLVKFLREKGVAIEENGRLERALRDNFEIDNQVLYTGAELQIPIVRVQEGVGQ